MARHDIVDLTDDTWIQLSNADISAATFMLVRDPRSDGADIAVTPDASAPADGAAYMPITRTDRAINEPLAELFPGVASPVRLWARGKNVSIAISHA